MDETEIISKYWFFPENFYFECAKGWYPLIDELCKKLDKLILEKHLDLIQEGDYKFQVLQVKEKFGELRFYVSGGFDDIEDLIDEYVKKSARTCELCGKPSEIRYSHGWLFNRCKECLER